MSEERLERIEAKIDHLTSRGMARDTNVGKLTGRVDGLDTKVDNLTRRVDVLDTRVDGLGTKVDDRLDQSFDEIKSISRDANHEQRITALERRPS